MARLFLIRHPETSYNNPAEERIRSLKDIPLDSHGMQQAKLLANLTKSLNPKVIYTSPLQRAKVTAMMIAKVHKVPVVVLDHLLPWNMGEWIGKLVSEVQPEMNRIITKDPNDAPKNGESFQHWFNNWQKTLEIMLDEAQDIEADGEDLIALTHYRNVRAARAMIKAGMKPHEYDKKIMSEKGNDDPASIVPILGPVNDKWIILPPIKMKDVSKTKVGS